MMDKFNDFSALKALKKDLEETDPSDRDAAPLPQKRSRPVVHKPKEQREGERVAKDRGLRTGCIVTLMDSNDRGILRHVHKDCVEIAGHIGKSVRTVRRIMSSLSEKGLLIRENGNPVAGGDFDFLYLQKG